MCLDVALMFVRKILMSVKFLSAILGPEMAAPILWTPGKNAFFLQEKPVSIKFLVLGGGVFWVFWGGGSADFIFMGARIFLKFTYACEIKTKGRCPIESRARKP